MSADDRTGAARDPYPAAVTKAAPDRTPPARARRRRPPGWVPNQHGAWAMLVVPPLVGVARSGPTWSHLLLLAAWLSAYLAFYAVGLWLKSHRKARYRPAAVTYAASTAALGVPLLVLHPELLRWGVVFAPLLALSLGYSARRDDRALANDLLTTAAASVMVVVAGALGADAAAPAPLGAFGFAWFPGGADERLWFAALVLFGYFAGTAFYVKTMIRERGSRGWLAASIAWHVGALGATLLAWPGAAWLMVVALVRAVVVPWKWPRLSAAQIGAGEVVVSALLAVVLAV